MTFQKLGQYSAKGLTKVLHRNQSQICHTKGTTSTGLPTQGTLHIIITVLRQHSLEIPPDTTTRIFSDFSRFTSLFLGLVSEEVETEILTMDPDDSISIRVAVVLEVASSYVP
jgi:hypothetical protein